MSYFLQYQAHVDDLTTLAFAPEDTSWFNQQPHEAPLPRELPSLGETVGDLTTGVFVDPDDGSAFIEASVLPLEAPTTLPWIGTSVGDYDSAAANPEDVSWLTSYPDSAPLRAVGPSLGWFAADLTTGAAIITDDGSWMMQHPGPVLLPPAILLEGFNVVDLDPVYAFVGWPFKYVECAHIGYDPTFLAYLRASAGTGYSRLYDVTAGAAVAGSEVTTTSELFSLVESGTIRLYDGHEYRTQRYVLDANVDAGEILGAGVNLTRTLAAGA